MRKFAPLSILLPLTVYSLAYGAATRTMSVANLDEDTTIVVDGIVNDQAWSNVEPYTGFTQQNPIEGAEATERTEVRLLLGRQTLYIGIINFDSDPSQILVTDSRRDGQLNETDSIQVVLDTYNDNQNAFLFGTNPVGIAYDGQVAGEGRTGGRNQRAGEVAPGEDKSADGTRTGTATGPSVPPLPSAAGRPRWRSR